MCTPGRCDVMLFHCDTAILLNGFVACNRLDDDIIVYVSTSNIPQRFEFTKSISDNETKITFDNPIQVEANKRCRIGIRSEIFQKINIGIGWHGFKVKSSSIQNGVAFQFNNTFCNHIHLITRVLFNIIDES